MPPGEILKKIKNKVKEEFNSLRPEADFLMAPNASKWKEEDSELKKPLKKVRPHKKKLLKGALLLDISGVG